MDVLKIEENKVTFIDGSSITIMESGWIFKANGITTGIPYNEIEAALRLTPNGILRGDI